MPNVKISTLPEATSISSTDVVPVVTGGITKKASAATIVKAVLPAPGAIGSTTPDTGAFTTLTIDANTSSSALRITQTGSGNAFVVEDSTSPDATPFVINQYGRVLSGIKTALTSGDLAYCSLQTAGDSGVGGNIGAIQFTNDASSSFYGFFKSRSQTPGTFVKVQNNDDLGELNCAGDDGTSFVKSGLVNFAVDGTVSTGVVPSRFMVWTSDQSGSLIQRQRIDKAGQVSFGDNVNPINGISLLSGRDITGDVNGFSIASWATIGSDVNNTAYGMSTLIGTKAAAFNVSQLRHFNAAQNTFGAGSTVTTQIGFSAAASLTGATNNYGFFGNIAAGTGRYNFYATGTADNWFSGNVVIGGAGGLGYTTGSGGAVTQTVSRTTGVTLNKTNGSITLVSAAGLATYQSFTVTNSTVAATDTIIINQKSGTDIYEVFITAVAAGSFRVTFATTGGVTTEQPVFNFAVIKAVTA